MDVNREQFWEDVDSGDVHIRDRWQFTLKSDFSPSPMKGQNRYIQDFYFFIPSSLQINSKTYSQDRFFIDQTTLIRYKTPEISFADLLNLNDTNSPLYQILALCKESDIPERRNQLSDELKLMANVVRSTLRRDAKAINTLINNSKLDPSKCTGVVSRIKALCDHIMLLRDVYANAQRTFLANWNDPLFYRQLLYIDEFLSDVIVHFLTGILDAVRSCNCDNLAAADQTITKLLLDEKAETDNFITSTAVLHHNLDSVEAENILYRSNLLNKFVLDALQLSTNRYSMDQRYKHYIGAVSAGVAILLYLILFAWLGRIFVINSAPFILIAAGFYIVKDRLKDWLKAVSYQKASEYFPDYTTVIRSLDSKRTVGTLYEDFSFIEPHQLPQEVRVLRNAEFHAVLETFQRPENIIFYRRVVEINNNQDNPDKRRANLNIIFRFNLHDLLKQASDPTETHTTIDPVTKELVSVRLPKVYHINMIIKSTKLSSDETQTVELKKLRIVVDKDGIRRIEQV